MFIVVAYDIASDLRRKRCLKTLKDYGKGVNLSVFECTVTAKEFETLKAKLCEIINPKKDTIIYYRLCDSCRKKQIALGLHVPGKKENNIVMV